MAPFAAQAALQLQRILLEAFTNVLKHARATRIVMHASWEDGTAPLVRIVLTDNGRGLPVAPAEGAAPRRHGIANMQARAQSIGARLAIETDPASGGARVALAWPRALP